MVAELQQASRSMMKNLSKGQIHLLVFIIKYYSTEYVYVYDTHLILYVLITEMTGKKKGSIIVRPWECHYPILQIS